MFSFHKKINYNAILTIGKPGRNTRGSNHAMCEFYFFSVSCNHSTIFHSDCSLTHKIIMMILNFIWARENDDEEENKVLFLSLTEAWCCSPIAVGIHRYAVRRCQRFLWLQLLDFHVINLAQFFVFLLPLPLIAFRVYSKHSNLSFFWCCPILSELNLLFEKKD